MSLQKTEMLSLGRKLFWLIALRSDLTDELIEKKVNIDENVMFSNLVTVETDLKEGEKKKTKTQRNWKTNEIGQWSPIVVTETGS